MTMTTHNHAAENVEQKIDHPRDDAPYMILHTEFNTFLHLRQDPRSGEWTTTKHISADKLADDFLVIVRNRVPSTETLDEAMVRIYDEAVFDRMAGGRSVEVAISMADKLRHAFPELLGLR